jgi:hypothetical protein
MKTIKIDLRKSKPPLVVKAWLNVYSNGIIAHSTYNDACTNALTRILQKAVPIEITVEDKI